MGHVLHAVLAINSEYVPAAQGVHIESLDAPVFIEYVPATQLWHTLGVVALVDEEYVPCTH